MMEEIENAINTFKEEQRLMYVFNSFWYKILTFIFHYLSTRLYTRHFIFLYLILVLHKSSITPLFFCFGF